jgi:hypothetical protein
MDLGVISINFPDAYNKNWPDKRTGETTTKIKWVNCPIFKKEGAHTKRAFLKKRAFVELERAQLL